MLRIALARFSLPREGLRWLRFHYTSSLTFTASLSLHFFSLSPPPLQTSANRKQVESLAKKKLDSLMKESQIRDREDPDSFTIAGLPPTGKPTTDQGSPKVGPVVAASAAPHLLLGPAHLLCFPKIIQKKASFFLLFIQTLPPDSQPLKKKNRIVILET